MRDGAVEVRAPKRATRADVDCFVRQKSHWIARQLASQAQQAAEKPTLEPGASIPYLGEPRKLAFQLGTRNDVSLSNDGLTIQTRFPETCKHTVFRQWLKRQAALHMTHRVYDQARHLGVGEQVSEVRFRFTKTKWGHCDSAGVLQFNPLIMMAPAAVVNYLIAHEVCHLVHMNHSRDFWDLVASLHPAYRQHRQWLRENAHRLKLE